MTPALFLENRATKRRFQIVGVDQGAGSVTLRGELAEFTESFDQKLGPEKTFERYGYRLVQGSAHGSRLQT